MLEAGQPALEVRFPDSPDQLSVTDFLNSLAALNDLYELYALAALPGYERSVVPTRLTVRRRSRLAPEDQLRIAQTTYGSDLVAILTVTAEVLAVPVIARGVWAVVKSIPGAVNFGFDTAGRAALLSKTLELGRQQLDTELRSQETQRLQSQLEQDRIRLQLIQTRQEMADLENRSLALIASSEVEVRIDTSSRRPRRTKVVRVEDGEEASVRLATLAETAVERVKSVAGRPTFRVLNDRD